MSVAEKLLSSIIRVWPQLSSEMQLSSFRNLDGSWMDRLVRFPSMTCRFSLSSLVLVTLKARKYSGR